MGISRQFFTFPRGQRRARLAAQARSSAHRAAGAISLIDFGFGAIGGQALRNARSLNWDIQDMVTKVTGSHTMKFGVNLRLPQGSNRQGSALSGNFSFSGLTTDPQRPAGTGSNLAQFLLGDVTSASCDRVTGATFVGYSLSWFVQDDWKVSRRLTPESGPAL